MGTRQENLFFDISGLRVKAAYPCRLRICTVNDGRSIMEYSSCESFIAAARTKRADLRPILKLKTILKNFTCYTVLCDVVIMMMMTITSI